MLSFGNCRNVESARNDNSNSSGNETGNSRQRQGSTYCVAFGMRYFQSDSFLCGGPFIIRAIGYKEGILVNEGKEFPVLRIRSILVGDED